MKPRRHEEVSRERNYGREKQATEIRSRDTSYQENKILKAGRSLGFRCTNTFSTDETTPLFISVKVLRSRV